MFGRGPRAPVWKPQPDSLGDDVVKSEARTMIKQFTPSATSPLKAEKQKDDLLNKVDAHYNEIPSPFN